MTDRSRWEELKRLFAIASELPPEQRRAALQRDADDLTLIEEALALCDAETVGVRIAAPVSDALDDIDPEPLAPGTRLGPWRIERELAQGGMGAIYLAARADGQYQQTVAIKLLRGPLSAEAALQMMRERQILADLQHPDIARLLDGGRSERGEPYIVMEYVEGERIDRWCEARDLGLEQRLRLFQRVCRALHHAHRHLVLHCDLKPSNVLVTDDGAPKLLDFGIARLMGHGDDARGPRFFTPHYASPEQRRGDALSTASDVYSLGILFYELLAGDASAEVEATARVPVSAAAAARDTRWAARLRGGLDALLAHMLDPDPAMRCSSAEAVADDIERWFARRPLRAHAPTLRYRAGLYLRRHWPAVATAAVFVAVIAAGVIGLARERDRAREAERIARDEADRAREVSDFMLAVFDYANPEHGARPETTARELLDAARHEIDTRVDASPGLKRGLLLGLGWSYLRLGLPNPALGLFEAARAQPVTEAPAAEVALRDALAHALWLSEDYDAAELRAREGMELARATLDANHPALGSMLNTLGMIIEARGRYDEAESVLREALSVRTEAHGADSDEVSAVLHNLGLIAHERFHLDEAEALFRRSLAIKQTRYGDRHGRTLNTLKQLANVERDRGRLEEALVLSERILELRLTLHDADSMMVGDAHNEIGYLQHDLGRFELAIEHYERALDIYAKVLGDDVPAYAISLNNLASALEDRGDYAAAEPLYRRSLAIREAEYTPEHPGVARARHNLGRLMTKLGRYDEAQALHDAALAARRAALGSDHRETVSSELALIDLAWQRGDAGAADAALALAARAERADDWPPRLTAAIDRVAANAVAADDPERARALFRRAEDALRTQLPGGHPLLAEIALERIVRTGDAADAASLAALREVLERSLADAHPARRQLEALARR